MGNKEREFGEYQNGKLICNCIIEISKILHQLTD